MFLKFAWNNHKVVTGSAADLARKTCLDRSTYGWTFCRACLCHINDPDTSVTVEKYGAEEINYMTELVGFRVINNFFIARKSN
jgi:hypothetical protein